MQEYWRVQTLVGEVELLERMMRDIDEEDIVWDVGANIGTHAVFFGLSLDGGCVCAFEPIPWETQQLRKNLFTNVDADR